MRHKGRLPDLVYVMRTPEGFVRRVAFRYWGDDIRYSRWGIQNRPPSDITESWREILSWLRQLEGNRAFIEVYPSDEEIVDTIPTRWFWLLPAKLVPREFNLCEQPPTPASPPER
jgi:hypothetical protein